MKTTLLCVEQTYDPGFTIRVAIDEKSAALSIINPDGIIAHTAEVFPMHPWWEGARKAMQGDYSALQETMDNAANGWQFRLGWRTAI